MYTDMHEQRNSQHQNDIFAKLCVAEFWRMNVIREYKGQPQISNHPRPLRKLYFPNIQPIWKQDFDPFLKVLYLLFSLLVIVDVLKVIG